MRNLEEIKKDMFDVLYELEMSKKDKEKQEELKKRNSKLKKEYAEALNKSKQM